MPAAKPSTASSETLTHGGKTWIVVREVAVHPSVAASVRRFVVVRPKGGRVRRMLVVPVEGEAYFNKWIEWRSDD